MGCENKERALETKIWDVVDLWYGKSFHSRSSPQPTILREGVRYGLQRIVIILENVGAHGGILTEELMAYNPQTDENILMHGREKSALYVQNIRDYIVECTRKGSIPETATLDSMIPE